MKNSNFKKWVFLLTVLFMGWNAMAQTNVIFLNAKVNADGSKVLVKFSKDMANPNGKHGQFTLKANGASLTINAAALNADISVIELTLSANIEMLKFVTISYSPGTVVAADGGTLSAFTNQNVANRTVFFKEEKQIASESRLPTYSGGFGMSVSISGDYAIVGAPNTGKGAAYIYKFDGINWVNEQKIVALDGAASDGFGCSVSISGNYVIVGANGDDDAGTSSGSAYIFKFDGTTWDQQQKLTASDAMDDDYFGSSVSISGDFVIVGAYRNDEVWTNAGSAYIYKFDGTTWGSEQKLTAPDKNHNDEWFGYSVSISGDLAIVGAIYDESLKGSAYFYKFNGTTWGGAQKLTATDGVAGDQFGCSVSISGDYAIVGAYEDQVGDVNKAGSAYIYKFDGTKDMIQIKLYILGAIE